ncbi:AAA family ATPase [Acidovorax sp. LjRoot38]|uniref:AAA family ATPase n=1 Tax=Acidovorax sp. LjRoot38 TaxID=3342327 RepID=UPI003F4F46CD
MGAKLATDFDASRPIAFFDENQRKFELSSGQKVILSFLAQLFHEARDNAVYLFDEPEVHLHPQFISLVMMTLYDALIATRSVAVLATHSPYVIRELNRDCVTVLIPSDAEIVAFARPTLQTRGASISAISEYVFEHSREASLTRARLQAYLMRESVGVPDSLIGELAGLVGSEGLNEVPEILAEGKGA